MSTIDVNTDVDLVLEVVLELCLYLMSPERKVKTTFSVYLGDQLVQLTLPSVVDLLKRLSTGCAQTVCFSRAAEEVQMVIDQAAAVEVELCEEAALFGKGKTVVSGSS